MAIFHISYDLMVPGQSYAKLTGAIQALGPYSHILGSTWLVQSNASAAQIRDALLPCLDANDRIIVTKINDWATKGIDQNTVNWLHRNA
jgi:hypothetical protein